MIKNCIQCGKEYNGIRTSKFCCRSCAATYNNLHRHVKKSEHVARICAVCGKECLVSKHTSNNKVRCNECQSKASKQKQAAASLGITHCLFCGSLLTNTQNKYCSVTCQHKFESEKTKSLLLSGRASGKMLSQAMRRILIQMRHCRCEECGWDKINPKTGLRPLQVHHIDGDCLNNDVNNLKVLCPNCHSLTETFGSSNKHSSRPAAYQAGKYYKG